jgi:vanillate O-demethylase monooxygenase subunit
MKYLREAWYAASWSEEITAKPIGLTMLDEPLVFYRNAAGQPIALSDTCPHRFAPLHLGKVNGDVITCPYHGLQFGADGKCVLNPHGPIPAGAHIRAYTVAERYGLLWVWMGLGLADFEKLPVLPEFSAEGLTWVHGTIAVGANYQLVIDNLMDLTHVEFMHPMLGMPGSSYRVKYEAKLEGDSVYSISLLENEPTSALIRILWPTAPDHTKFDTRMCWRAPSNLMLGMSVTTVDGDLSDPVLRMPTAHILTPISGTETRYLWAAARNVAVDNDEFSAMLKAGSEAAFQHEDEPMVAAVQARMAMLEGRNAQPVLFKSDAGVVQARRVLERLIAAEQMHPAE